MLIGRCLDSDKLPLCLVRCSFNYLPDAVCSRCCICLLSLVTVSSSFAAVSQLVFSRPVLSTKSMTALTAVIFGFQYSFGPSISFPLALSTWSPHPPSMYDKSPHCSPIFCRSVCRARCHKGQS